jgi:general secretion pathway protein M
MKEWFANLQPRERAIFLGGALAAVLILVWGVALRPLQTGSAVLRESVASKQRLLVEVQQLDGLPASPDGPREGADQALVRLVGNSATQHGVELTRTRADGPNGIQATFGNASFDTLLTWLIALETENAVKVESASFTNTRQPGLVSGQVLLRR